MLTARLSQKLLIYSRFCGIFSFTLSQVCDFDMRMTSEATDNLEPELIRDDITKWLTDIATKNTANPVEPFAQYNAILSENPMENGLWHPNRKAIYSLWAPFWLNVRPVERSTKLQHVQYVGPNRIQPLEDEDVQYTQQRPFLNGIYIEVADSEGGIQVSVQSEPKPRATSLQDSTPLEVVNAVELPISQLELVEFEVVKRRTPMSFDRPRV
jgi:hypothetical protein